MDTRIAIIIIAGIILFSCLMYKFSRKRIDSGAYLSGYPEMNEPILHTDLLLHGDDLLFYKKSILFGKIPLQSIVQIHREKMNHDIKGASTGILLSASLLTTAVTDSFLAGMGAGILSNILWGHKKDIFILIIEWNLGDTKQFTGFAFAEEKKAEQMQEYIEKRL